MKLAFCLFHYSPYGGLQRDFLRIAKACVQRGHDVHIYTISWQGEHPPGFTIHLLPVKARQNHTRCLAFVKQLRQQLSQAAYDVVIGFNKMPMLDIYFAADVCYQARVRQDRSGLYRCTPRYRAYVALEKAVFAPQQATQVLLIAPAQQAAYSACYGTEPERFQLLPPGIDRARQAPANATVIRADVRERHHMSEDHFLLLLVGSGFKTKGLDRAIYALAALPTALRQRCHFYVIGEDRPDAYAALAQRLGLSDQVRFLGGRDDVAAWLLAGDVLLHPAYHENTGTVLLEAVIAGLPVLTVDVCGYAHYVTEAEAGVVLSSPFSQAALNAALAQMLTSTCMSQWRANGLAFAKREELYSNTEVIVACIENTVRKQGVPPSKAVIYRDAAVAQYLQSFEHIMALRGEQFRAHKGRLTQRLMLGDQAYFIKQHAGVGWAEIIKNLLQGRLPVISAKNEWRAIARCHALGVHVPQLYAFGERGINPAARQSFVLMGALNQMVSLETWCAEWPLSAPSFSEKRRFITEVANIARTLHENGVNHRDFYLCHFLFDPTKWREEQQLKLYLIDLHRAQLRRVTPQRWIIKDLAGLYFSSKAIGLTKQDLYHFMKIYRRQSLRAVLSTEHPFWKKVKGRGEQLYSDHQ